MFFRCTFIVGTVTSVPASGMSELSAGMPAPDFCLPDAISIMTVHAAKGLEFPLTLDPAAFLVDVEEAAPVFITVLGAPLTG